MDLREKLRAKRNIKGLVHLSQLNLKQNQGKILKADGSSGSRSPASSSSSSSSSLIPSTSSSQGRENSEARWSSLAQFSKNILSSEASEDGDSMQIRTPSTVSISNIVRSATTGGDTAVKLFIVLDTNIFLDPCFSLDDLVDSSFVDFGAAHIVIPWKVLEELDCLKSDLSIGEKTQKARNAIAQINQYLRSCHPRVVGQTKEKGHSANFFRPQSSFDDSILQSCLSVLKENQPCAVILLSNDVNLGNKAMFHGIASVQLVDLKSNLITSDQGTRFTSPLSCQQEPRTSPQMDQNPACPDPEQSIKYLVELKKVLTRDLSFMMVEELKGAFQGMQWREKVKKPPPWRTTDMLEILQLMWPSVFGKVWPTGLQAMIGCLHKTFLDLSGKGKSATLEEVMAVTRAWHGFFSTLSRNHRYSYSERLKTTLKCLKALLEKMESAVSAISEGTQGDRVISPKGGLPTYGQTIDMELMAMPDPLQCEEDNDIDPVNLPQEVSTSHTIVNAVLGALRLISYNVKVFTDNILYVLNETSRDQIAMVIHPLPNEMQCIAYMLPLFHTLRSLTRQIEMFLRNVSEASSEGLAIALNCFFFQLGLEEEAAGRINLKPCQVFQYGQHIETLEMLEPELWTLKDCQAKLGDLLGEV